MISRRHCAVVRRDDAVVIVDLGSRNKTIVNGKELSTGKPVRLFDQDKIQIGKVKFRVLIQQESGSSALPLSNDSQYSSGGALDSGGESLGALLQELDDIASKFAASKIPAKEPEKSPAEAAGDAGGENGEGGEKPDDEEKQEEDRSDSLTTATIELTRGQPGEEFEDEDEDEEDEEEDEEEEQSGPKRLPAHLRNRGPVDSQEAAANALKNIFNRR